MRSFLGQPQLASSFSPLYFRKRIFSKYICSIYAAKQRYIYSKQTKKSENKDTVIKFLLSCNIRSLCNTAHCSERHVPTTGHRRQNTRIKYINSLGHHKSNLALLFLDVLVEKSPSKFITSIYRKPTFTSQYLCWNSFSPRKRKTNLILTLTHWALAICSPERLPSELHNIKFILLSNGYPEQ